MFSISVASDMSGSFGSQRAECEVTEERICDLFGRERPLRIEPLRDPVRGTEAELAQQIHVDIRAQRGVRRCLRDQVVGELLVALALARDRALDARGQRAPVVEQHVERVLARQQDPDVLDDREAEPLERIRARGRGCDDAFDQAIDRPLHQRREDVLLRRVAVMQTARQHAGRARDVAQRGPGVALLAKQPRRRLQGTVVVGAGFGRCLGHLTKSLPEPLHRAQAKFGQPTKEAAARTARCAAATAPCIAAAPAARAAYRVCVLRVVIAVLLVAIGSAGAAERTGLLAPRALHAKRATSPIAIDGTLDEPAWDGAAPAEHLIPTRPRPGEESPHHTPARVVFEDDALYVGVRLDDPHAELIQAPLGRRDDETTSDWCFVEIDSRHDHRSAFSFGGNAAGMQVDGVFGDDVTYDSSWNAVWQVAATRDAHGWTAEYRIPFSVFAFSRPKPGTPMVWGLNIYRSNPASGDSANWSPRIPQLAGVVSLFNDLVIDAAPSPRRIDLAPYGRASTRDGLRGCLDLDVALGSNLAMVATVLPDFGQVDADPAQLNLTAFELFLPERRPFFTEGLDAFRFDTSLPLVSRGDSFADEAPFYTRRIGRVVDGVATPILGAVKLYGRADDGWRAGVLAAATREVAADGAPIAAPEQAAIARVIKEGGDGEHAVGLLATGLHRSGELGLPRVEPGDAFVAR